MRLIRAFMRAADQEIRKPTSQDLLEQRIQRIDRRYQRQRRLAIFAVIAIPMIVLVLVCTAALQLL